MFRDCLDHMLTGRYLSLGEAMDTYLGHTPGWDALINGLRCMPVPDSTDLCLEVLAFRENREKMLVVENAHEGVALGPLKLFLWQGILCGADSPGMVVVLAHDVHEARRLAYAQDEDIPKGELSMAPTVVAEPGALVFWGGA